MYAIQAAKRRIFPTLNLWAYQFILSRRADLVLFHWSTNQDLASPTVFPFPRDTSPHLHYPLHSFFSLTLTSPGPPSHYLPFLE